VDRLTRCFAPSPPRGEGKNPGFPPSRLRRDQEQNNGGDTAWTAYSAQWRSSEKRRLDLVSICHRPVTFGVYWPWEYGTRMCRGPSSVAGLLVMTSTAPLTGAIDRRAGGASIDAIGPILTTDPPGSRPSAITMAEGLKSLGRRAILDKAGCTLLCDPARTQFANVVSP
jgi:hypothetical protein